MPDDKPRKIKSLTQMPLAILLALGAFITSILWWKRMLFLIVPVHIFVTQRFDILAQTGDIHGGF